MGLCERGESMVREKEKKKKRRDFKGKISVNTGVHKGSTTLERGGLTLGCWLHILSISHCNFLFLS